MRLSKVQEFYPLTFEAICNLAYDNQFELNTRFTFPSKEGSTFNNCEKFFKLCTEEERELFIFGEHEEKLQMINKVDIELGTIADEFFEEMFQGQFIKVFK